MNKPSKHVTTNPWQSLNKFTDARIGLGRSGISIPTAALLEFQLAHAQAQDAVHQPLEMERLTEQLQQLTDRFDLQRFQILQSQAADRSIYLQRPDLGRRLCTESAEQLQPLSPDRSRPFDLAIAIVDGLSSRAITENTAPFLQQLLAALEADTDSWSVAPLTLVRQGRVAIGDEIGELLNARTMLVLIGERPGLSSPDSLGLYLTWAPNTGLTDANRNCISNVRKAGLSYSDAVRKAIYLLRESRRLQLSGVQLKERSTASALEEADTKNNFLISNS